MLAGTAGFLLSARLIFELAGPAVALAGTAGFPLSAGVFEAVVPVTALAGTAGFLLGSVSAGLPVLAGPAAALAGTPGFLVPPLPGSLLSGGFAIAFLCVQPVLLVLQRCVC